MGTDQSSEIRKLIIKSIAAAIVGIPLFIWKFVGSDHIEENNQIAWIVIGILTLAIMWFSGRHFFIGAFKAFKSHRANMFTLIALATGPAWLYSMLISIWPTLVPQAARVVHYDAALMVIAFIIFGSVLETKANEKTSKAINRMNDHIATSAQVLQDSKPQTVPIEEITPDSLIQVSAGELIPVDGKIREGSSSIDESLITGEKKSVDKTKEDTVFAGTKNLSDNLLIEMTHKGNETALEQIIKKIKQAQNIKPPIGEITDQIAAILAPVVLIIALFSALMWIDFGPRPPVLYPLIVFMAVLLIACPCALGLATPIALSAGMGKASECGAFFQKGVAIQNIPKLNTLYFDENLAIANKHEIASIAKKLQKLKVRPVLISSKDVEKTRALAKELSIEDVLSDLSSEEIKNQIEKGQAHGMRIGYISYDSNEAAFGAANVGFIMGAQASQSKNADIIILGNSLYTLIDAIRISKWTIRNIKQNLSGAFLYNGIGTPVATGIFYPLIGALLSPILAGILMACSSLGVILNANRLYLFKPTRRNIS